MYGYVYIVTNDINGMQYIGRHKSEVFPDPNYLGSGVYFKKAVNKYGKENFTVRLLESVESEDELVLKEMYWIQHYNAVESTNFYNNSHGGYSEGFIRGGQNIACSERSRKLNSLAHKGKKMPSSFGEHQRQLHIGKPSGMLGKKHSDETKQKMSIITKQNNLNRDPIIYKKVSETAKGNKMMNKDGKCIRVHPQDFEKFLSIGWQFGGTPRKTVDRSGVKNPMYGKSAVRNLRWVNRDGVRKYVPLQEIDAYLNSGWKLGMK